MDAKRNTLSEEEIIGQAEEACEHGTLVESTANPGKLLAALDFFYMNGSHDDQTGNVEAPDGHVFRVHRWLVRTDNYGFKTVETFDSEAEAITAMVREDEAYCRWAGDDE